MSQLQVARDGYTILDYISDIGGMQSLLISMGGLFLTIWNYKNFDNYLVTQLYRLDTQKDKKTKDAGEVMVPNYTSNLRDYFCSYVPKKCKCCI